jgi:hypothetical protein
MIKPLRSPRTQRKTGGVYGKKGFSANSAFSAVKVFDKRRMHGKEQGKELADSERDALPL